MRILMVPHAYLPAFGGVERMVQQLARALGEEGHHVAVLTDALSGSPSVEAVDGVEVFRMPFIPGGGRSLPRFIATWPEARRRIRQIVSEFRPDVIHQHVTSSNSTYAALAASVGDCPLVITTHGSHRRNLNARGLAAERRHCEKAVAISHCSRAAMDQFSLKHPELVNKSRVIHNGISLQDFETVTPDCGEVPRVVFAGRIDGYKGIDTLLQAAKLVRDRRFKLVMIGDGPERERLQKQSRTLGLDRVQWRGIQSLPQVISALRGAAAYVLPSREEGFPMGTLEAMAVRCPVIAGDVGGIPEQIRDGIDGLLVQPGDPDRLAAAISAVLDDPSRARWMAENAFQRITGEFTWHRIVPQYLSAYRAESQSPSMASLRAAW